eukprot:TRINITY_DN101841_c0_g1_i1.p1 TRINITY_DN101841_c0_g1~~TRINITY_DN101841_c0_g1_i1.p1  ORF type:complete len:767 (-),score=207.31 TRINITY_DN101841_c0_g1_i1:107-2341(-)
MKTPRAGGSMLVAILCLSLLQPCSALLRRQQHESEQNPLLEDVVLPRFAAVEAEKHAKPAVTDSLQKAESLKTKLETKLSAMVEDSSKVAFSDVAEPLQAISEEASRAWGRLQHLNSVVGSDSLRAAIQDLEPKVVAFQQALGQSKPIFSALVKVRDGEDFKSLSEARQRIVLNEIRDRKLSGAALAEKDAKELTALNQRLSQLSSDFGNHLLDATATWNLTIHDKARMRGVPLRALDLAAAKAEKAGFKNATSDAGPWVLGLDAPLLGPVITYAEDRKLRQELYMAAITKASFGSNDNTPTMAEILEKRQRSAEILGYASYADLSFVSKMASRESVHNLMDELHKAAKPHAEVDLKELREFAQKTDGLQAMKHWDRGFYTERLRKEKYDYDSEKLREYFPLPHVLEGVFGLSQRLFGVTVEAMSTSDAEVKEALWHKDVMPFKVTQGSSLVGYIFFDSYSRPGQKRAGAWLQPLTSLKRDGDKVLQYPVAFVICNFPPPGPEKVSLLSFGEVETLFHEFGHGLQHLLTRQGDAAVSGLNGVEWDAVEIASQFMEYWVTEDEKTLFSFAKHYKTQDPLPRALYSKLRQSMNFRSGSATLGAVYMSLVDLRLHEQFKKGEDIFAINAQVAKERLLEPLLPEDRFLCAFSHIFAGGYAAGYYSYQWSKVLSADAFSAFEEAHGLANETHLKATGERFASTFLAEGGGRPPSLVFQDFRGRKPSTAALLKYSGLGPAALSADAAFLF